MSINRRTLLAAPFALALSPVMAAAPNRAYLLATASPGGTFYPVGVALAALIKATLQPKHGISLTAATTAGSAQNIRLLGSGEAQFAILQGLVGSDARQGKGLFAAAGPERTIRSLTALWPNVEQFLIHARFRKSGTIMDLAGLKGQPVVFGNVGSGTLASCDTLLGNLGLDIGRDFKLVHMGYGPAAEALQRGEVAAIALPAGLPTKSLARLRAAMGNDAAILEFTAEQAQNADGGRNLWHPYRIPAGTYPAQDRDIQTIAQPNFLAIRGDVPDGDAYLVTRAIFDNLPLLQGMHDATRAMALDRALSGLPMPLHPGAVRYFQEKKLAVPRHLLSD